jgi:uncharacterized protein with PIN domain
MRPAVIVDSSVLVAFCDPEDQLHPVVQPALAERLATSHQLIVPASVLSEVLVGAYQASPHAVRTVEGFVDNLATLVAPLDRRTARAAAQYRAAHPTLPLLAAFVFATAKTVNAQQILTTNPSWKNIDDRAHILR